MEEGKKKNDVILIGILLMTALAVYFGMSLFQGATTKNGVAVVKIDEAEYGRFPLAEDTEEKIELPDGSYNLLIIKEGEADIAEASCPDGICVSHRAISRQGQSIVCLPNKVVVEIENGGEPELDAVTN